MAKKEKPQRDLVIMETYKRGSGLDRVFPLLLVPPGRVDQQREEGYHEAGWVNTMGSRDFDDTFSPDPDVTYRSHKFDIIGNVVSEEETAQIEKITQAMVGHNEAIQETFPTTWSSYNGKTKPDRIMFFDALEAKGLTQALVADCFPARGDLFLARFTPTSEFEQQYLERYNSRLEGRCTKLLFVLPNGYESKPHVDVEIQDWYARFQLAPTREGNHTHTQISDIGTMTFDKVGYMKVTRASLRKRKLTYD